MNRLACPEHERGFPTTYPLIRRLLFLLEAERAHGLGLAAVRARGALPLRLPHSPNLQQDLFGRRFPNPVGLAAGMDKDARAVRGFAALGFGFVEVGTLTPRPQPGNPRPRMFRHTSERSLRNALGFNNGGAADAAERLRRLAPLPVPVGVNVGKNRETPIERAVDDYESAFTTLAGCGDYYVINVSSPNTPGLRDLQRGDAVGALVAVAKGASGGPVLVKISPDLVDGEATEMAVAAMEAGADGVIATNTTTDRSRLPDAPAEGGVSGAALTERSFAVLRAIAPSVRAHGGILVSVGGIASADEAWRRIVHGADLVQLYTGLVYEGPGLPRALVRGLAARVERAGFEHVSEAIGSEL